MKFVTALSAAAAIAVVVEGGKYTKQPRCHKGNKSEFAKKRVQETKDRMELVYGKGLVGLMNERG